MGRFLFTCHDAGGTIPPVLAAARGVIDRGHQVTILSQPSVQARAVGAGCGFIAFSEVGDYRRDVALEEQLDRTIPIVVGESVGADLTTAAQQIGADVVVVDPNLAGALGAAETLEQPSAVLLHSLFKTFVDVWFGELWAVLAEPINTTRRSLGTDNATSWADMLGRHELILSPVPFVLDAAVDDPPPQLNHVGFLVPSIDGAEAVDPPPGAEPLVVVSLSTTCQHQDRVVAQILAALADEPIRVVATTSGYGDAAQAPANATVVEFAPHAALFEHADLVITHGGLGTTAAALSAGLPLLFLPMGRDQQLNAERVAALGAGRVHTIDSGADALRRDVRHMLNEPSYGTRATEIASASRTAGEATAAASALESLLG